MTPAVGGPRTRVMIADDHAVVRHGLRALVETQPDLAVVAEAGDAPEAIAEARRVRPDVLLLDLGMPGGGGMRVLEQLAGSTPAIRILILSMHDDPAYIRSAFAGGALGYVVKRARGSDVLDAIRAVARGDRYVDPVTTGAVVGAEAPRDNRGPRDAARPRQLTERERRVLQLLAEGHTNLEVGAHLGISVKTVETHRGRLSRKLGARSRADLVRYALHAGLLRLDQVVDDGP